MTIRTKTPFVGLSTLVVILFATTASAQTRAFMDASGNAGAGQPTTGNTVITMDPVVIRDRFMKTLAASNG